MTSSIHTDQQPGPAAGSPALLPEADLPSYVLAIIDDHLAVLHAVRDQLTTARAIRPGTRRDAAAYSVAAARRYAEDMARALSLPN